MIQNVICLTHHILLCLYSHSASLHPDVHQQVLVREQGLGVQRIFVAQAEGDRVSSL